MNWLLTAWQIGVASAGVVFAAALPRRAPRAAERDVSALASLAGLMAALLAVGVVSQTLQRHVIQIAPIVVALLLIAARSPYGAAAAAPLCTFWLGLMVNIWLFLLGVLR